MKPSEVFRRAAERVADCAVYNDFRGMCNGVNFVVWSMLFNYENEEECYSLQDRCDDILWGLFTHPGAVKVDYYMGENTAENADVRVLALLFAADIAEGYGE